MEPDPQRTGEMKRKRFREEQIIGILCEYNAGIKVADLASIHGMSSASFYKLRAKYSGMHAFMITRMKTMEDEN